MMKLKRLDEPVPSPDGKWVVFSATDVDLEANTKTSHLWIVPANGGESKRLKETPNHEQRPRFSPDGKRLIWTSKATDPSQIWMCDFDSNAGTLGGKPHQVTNISTGADVAIWSPDGKNIVFVSAVYPDCKDDACNKQRDEEIKNSKVKAKIFTKLFYRHDGGRKPPVRLGPEENFHQSRRRHHVALFAGRKIHSMALTSPRRLRSR
jgi:dipeptidyl aminopeptidase/acylaminoacyl peptidase